MSATQYERRARASCAPSVAHARSPHGDSRAGGACCRLVARPGAGRQRFARPAALLSELLGLVGATLGLAGTMEAEPFARSRRGTMRSRTGHADAPRFLALQRWCEVIEVLQPVRERRARRGGGAGAARRGPGRRGLRPLPTGAYSPQAMRRTSRVRPARPVRRRCARPAHRRLPRARHAAPNADDDGDPASTRRAATVPIPAHDPASTARSNGSSPRPHAG